MKKLSIHQIRNVLAIVIIAGVSYGAYVANPSYFKAENAGAVGANTSGWAWSKGTGTTASGDNPAGPYSGVVGSNPGIGWISFSSVSGGGTQSYGVTVNMDRKGTNGIGAISGQAWAGNDSDSNGNPTGIGWISFDRGVTGNPPTGFADPGLSKTDSPLAYVDWSESGTVNNVHGWARAIVACKDTNWNGAKCTSASDGDKAGGWDGWIKLSKDSVDTGDDYGVKISANKFSGNAWGGDVIGWIDFAPTVNGIPLGVQVSASPCVEVAYNSTNPDPTIAWGTCSAFAGCTEGASGQNGIIVGGCSTGGTFATSCNNAVCPISTPVSQPGVKKTKFWQF